MRTGKHALIAGIARGMPPAVEDGYAANSPCMLTNGSISAVGSLLLTNKA
jgi:hypothetical protein